MHSILPLVITVPTLIITLFWLAYLNFKNFRDGWPLWRRNLLGFAGAVVFIVVTTVRFTTAPGKFLNRRNRRTARRNCRWRIRRF